MNEDLMVSAQRLAMRAGVLIARSAFSRTVRQAKAALECLPKVHPAPGQINARSGKNRHLTLSRKLSYGSFSRYIALPASGKRLTVSPGACRLSDNRPYKSTTRQVLQRIAKIPAHRLSKRGLEPVHGIPAAVRPHVLRLDFDQFAGERLAAVLSDVIARAAEDAVAGLMISTRRRSEDA